MGHLERGEKNASLGSVARVAHALGVTLSELLAGVDAPVPPDGDESAAQAVTSPEGKSVKNRAADVNRILDELQLERQALRETVLALKEVALKRGAAKRSRNGGERRTSKPRKKNHSS